MSTEASDRILAALQGSSALTPPARVLAMLSGGADSVCLLHALARHLGPGRVQALHVNHGLRAAADEDERFCAELCEALGVRLHVERVEIPGRLGRESRGAGARGALRGGRARARAARGST